MKNFPSRIEVVIEPYLYAMREGPETVEMTVRVTIDGQEIAFKDIKPSDYFLSHFDRAMEEAKYHILKHLDDRADVKKEQDS